MERPFVSDSVCAVVVDLAHCVSKWYVLELCMYPISVAHLAYWLKPIGIANPDGEKLIAIKFSNCAVQYKRNTSNKNPFYCPAILYYGIIRVRTFSRISLVNAFTENNLRSNFSKLICE